MYFRILIFLEMFQTFKHIIENIEISGDCISDPEVDVHLSEWNKILDTILI